MSNPVGLVRNVRLPRFAEEAVDRARLAVVPRQRRGPAPRVPFAILVGLVLLGGVAGLLMFNTHMQKNSFAATALQTRADELHAREQQLRAEIDKLSDPQAIALAAKRMGMQPQDSPAFLDLATGRTTGNTKPSTGVNDFRVSTPDAAKPNQLTPKPLVLPRKVVTDNDTGTDAGTGAADQDTTRSTGTKKTKKHRSARD